MDNGIDPLGTMKAYFRSLKAPSSGHVKDAGSILNHGRMFPSQDRFTPSSDMTLAKLHRPWRHMRIVFVRPPSLKGKDLVYYFLLQGLGIGRRAQELGEVPATGSGSDGRPNLGEPK